MFIAPELVFRIHSFLNSQAPELAGASYLSMYKRLEERVCRAVSQPRQHYTHGKAHSQNTAFTNQENYDIFTFHANAPNTPAKSVIHQPRYRAFQPSSSTIRFAASVKPRYGSNSSRNPITSSVPASGASGSS